MWQSHGYKFHWPKQIKINVTGNMVARSRFMKVGTIQMKTNTKRNLVTFAAIGAIALGRYACAEPQGDFGGRHGGWHGQGFAMPHLSKALNLTPDQQSKVQ